MARLGTGLLALAIAASAPLTPMAGAAEPREATVYKDPSCGCCQGWASYLRRNGYKVTVVERQDMDRVKKWLNVPEHLQSCHTAVIDGKVVEGHVPVEAIDKFFKESSGAKGLASPGMPSGSPGMDGPKQPNPVTSFGPQGEKLVGVY